MCVVPMGRLVMPLLRLHRLGQPAAESSGELRALCARAVGLCHRRATHHRVQQHVAQVRGLGQVVVVVVVLVAVRGEVSVLPLQLAGVVERVHLHAGIGLGEIILFFMKKNMENH